MAWFMLSWAMPLWLLCASSMITAKRLSLRSAMPSMMKGNFWIVVMMIFLPFSSAAFRSAERIAGATMFFTSEKSLMLSRSCLSSRRRSVTTITLSNSGASSARAPGSSRRCG